MMSNIKKTKSADSLLEEYLNNIYTKCDEKMPTVKRNKKNNQSNDLIIVPTIDTYNDLIYNNYNITQLKGFAKKYGLKIGGSKPQLISRIYRFLYFSSYIIKIQKIFRGYLVKNYIKLRGPAILCRTICTNNADFITMDPIEEIPFNQFISYKDVDGFIYGFDITSIHNLILKSDFDVRNPYNRNLIPEIVLKNLRSIIRYGRILKLKVKLKIEDDPKALPIVKSVGLRAITVFQKIDELGNYTDARWFLSLDKFELIKFLKELNNIWRYRAQLSNQMKRNICPPFGDPFRTVIFDYIKAEQDLDNIKSVLLDVMERLVNSGIDRDSKSLGAYYILGALTLVNEEAATSLPWLYQSVQYT